MERPNKQARAEARLKRDLKVLWQCIEKERTGKDIEDHIVMGFHRQALEGLRHCSACRFSEGRGIGLAYDYSVRIDGSGIRETEVRSDNEAGPHEDEMAASPSRLRYITAMAA